MGNNLRSCLACMCPCGVLDVVRVVHLNGRVEEHSRHITAAGVLAASPNHVLTEPCSQGMARKIVIVAPELELKRGHIYFLIPTSALPEQKRSRGSKKHGKLTSRSSMQRKDREILLEKRITHRRRCSRVGEWQPKLESICEGI
ncbi:uncharacterized protein LOC122014819 [Zingiber officinale]|uniref:Uncharacterized protein n=1 Tax=Zingiber officinale TaxID=94328 RepID=A0A8J5F8D6_ZINOF|nr:uncharacterized protein LOC122014819 [Zingiber officinale]KAG6481483.1 hypothetical protein ZIOFF_058087 [Zingiber officinale]